LDIAFDAIEPTSGFISHDDPNTIDARSLLQDSGVISAGSLPRLRALRRHVRPAVVSAKPWLRALARVGYVHK